MCSMCSMDTRCHEAQDERGNRCRTPFVANLGMKNMRDDLPGLLEQLLDGWNERVEYAVHVQLHTYECHEAMVLMTITDLRHYECDCPSTKEYRVDQRWQAPMLTQLVEAGFSVPPQRDKSGGGTSVKKPPEKVTGE